MPTFIRLHPDVTSYFPDHSPDAERLERTFYAERRTRAEYQFVCIRKDHRLKSVFEMGSTLKRTKTVTERALARFFIAADEFIHR